ncbi:11071_t:CDS:2, partial [Racocetra persica]
RQVRENWRCVQPIRRVLSLVLAGLATKISTARNWYLDSIY